MLVYQETGKTKSGELRITRPIGALMFVIQGGYQALNNEKISVFVERAGTSIDIAVNVPLKDFIALTTYGLSAVKSGLVAAETYSRALCEIAENGSIMLGTNESVKVVLTDLNSNKEYTIYGIEYPTAANAIAKFDKRTLLDGEASRRFDVMNSDVVVLNGFDAVTEVHVTYENGITTKYTNEEFRMLAFDVDPIEEINAGVAAVQGSNYVTFPLLAVNSIDVYKNAGLVTITTLDENELYN